jgi:hypothetical protein
MIKRLLFILIIVLTISGTVDSQNFILSNSLTSNSQVTIVDLKKVSDGTVVSGYFLGTLNVPTNNTATVIDGFIAKYDENFELVWLQHIGGTFAEFPYNIAIHDNYVYVVGTYKGTCNFDEGAEELTAIGGNFDSFLAKYNLDGTFVWAKPYAYNEADQQVRAIDIDKNANLVIGGYYKDSIDIAGDKYIESNGLFISQADTSGTLLWSKSIATDNLNTRIEAISAFEDGYYCTGNLEGLASFDVGSKSSNDPLYTDAFIYKTDFSGNGMWVRKTYGYGSSDTKTGTTTGDNYGNIYFTGYFGGTYIQVDENSSTISTNQLVNNGDLDAFIIKYNKTGDLSWSFNYGNKGEEWARDIEYQNGFLYLTGYFSDTLYVENDTLISSDPADYDALLAMFDSEGNLLRAAQIDDANDGTTSGTSLDVDNNNNAYWGGDFKASQIVIGDSTFNLAGTKSTFISRYKPTYTVAFTKKQDVTCNGGNDGELIVTPYFGVPPFNYSWSHNGLLNDSSATSLIAGTYIVTVTDALDSTDIAQYYLSQPDSFIFSPDITMVTSCSDSTEGAIDLNVTGGNGGNSYFWFESEGGNGVLLTNEDQTSLSIGRYDVTVTDQNSCFDDTTIYITGPSPVIFNETAVTDDSGPDGSPDGGIDLTLTGGTGAPATYAASWTGPAAYIDSTQDIINLVGGNYNVTVTDDNSCTFDSMFTVRDLDTLFADISNKKDDCTGGAGDGTATVSYYTPNPTPVIIYDWSHDVDLHDSIATGLSVGTYYVTVTDSDSSWTSVDSVEIFDLGYTMAGNLSGTTDLNCKGDANGYIDLTLSTPGQLPYIYNWSNGALTQDIVNLPAGTYSVTITDDNSCTLQISDRVISEPEFDLIASTSIVDEPSCNGDFDGRIRVDGAGGNDAPFTYQWNDPGSQTSQIADGLDAGFYTVTVTDFKGCAATDNVNLTEPDVLSVSAIVGDLNCFDNNSGTIALTVTGGTVPMSYLWSSSDGIGLVAVDKNQSGLSAGTYEVIVTDTYACEAVDSFLVSEPILLQIDTENKTDVTTCNGDNTGTITIAASGGTGVLTYTLNPGAVQTNTTGIFTGLIAGTYNVDVDDVNGCGPITSSTIVIGEPTVISIAETSVNDITCNGLADGSIDITASGGTVATVYTYSWITTEGSGLVASSEDQTGLGAGTYNLTVTDDNTCTGITSIVITEPTILNITETAVLDITCNGLTDGSIDITVSGGILSYTYSWTTTDGSGLVAVDKNQSGLSAGTYEVIVTDTYACEAVDSFLVSEPILLQIDTENKTDVTTCNGDNTGTITIAASGGTGVLTYTLNPGAVQTNTTGIFTGLIAGTYNVDVDDVNGCGPITSSTIVIGEPTVISIAETSVNDITCNGLADGSIDITASGGTVATVYTYSWITTEGSGLVASSEDQTGLGAGTYNLTVTDDNTCTGITSIVITEPTILNITETAVLDITCNGLTDGSIDITVSGGILSYTYSWTTTDGSGLVAASEDQTGLGAGTYDLTVTDGNLCTGTGTIVIIEPTAISIDSENFTDATTQTAADGSVTLTASGGTGTLEYTLSPGTIINTTGVFSNLIPDDYTVNVTDDNACGPVSSNTITVGYPDAIIDISKSDKIKMYPNPTSDKLFIEIDYEFDNLKIEVLSISGQIILNKEIKSHGITKEVLDLSAYPKGVYFIRVYRLIQKGCILLEFIIVRLFLKIKYYCNRRRMRILQKLSQK